MDWAVAQELLRGFPAADTATAGDRSPVPFLFDAAQARRLLDAAAALPDNARAARRGTAYRTIFALCYGLGLRAGEACGLRVGDVDTERNLLVVAGGKFGKSRLVPHGPRIATLVGEQLGRRRAAGVPPPAAPLFSFDGRRCVHPCTASQVFHRLVTTLDLTVPDGVSPPTLHSLRHSFAVGCLLRWYREGVDPSAGSISSRRSWVTSTRHRRLSTSRSRPRCWRRRTAASRTSPRMGARSRHDE